MSKIKNKEEEKEVKTETTASEKTAEVKEAGPQLQEGKPIPLTPFTFGTKDSKEGSEWAEDKHDPSRYIIAAKLSGLAETDPTALAFCSDIPEGTPGKTKETAITVKDMFELYTKGPTALLRSDFQTPIQDVFLKLFQESTLVNATVTLTIFAPNGGMVPLTLGYINPMVSYGNIPEESEKLLGMAVMQLAKALEKKITGGIVVPDTQIKMPKRGDLILPG